MYIMNSLLKLLLHLSLRLKILIYYLKFIENCKVYIESSLKLTTPSFNNTKNLTKVRL